MLIQLIITIFGVGVGSSLTKINNSIPFSTNDSTASLLTLRLSNNSKSKREIGEFAFGSNVFGNDNVLSNTKINGVNYHDNNNNNNVKEFIPPSTVKVIRSNSQNLEAHDPNPKLSSNYQSKSSPNKKSMETKLNMYLNEDPDSINQFTYGNNPYRNQVSVPGFESFLTQPKYVITNPGSSSDDSEYKPSIQFQYDSYPILTEFSSNIPIYNSVPQIPSQSFPKNNYVRSDQLTAPQYTPYTTQLKHGIKTLQPIQKIYTSLNRENLQHQLQPQFPTIDQNVYANVQFTTSRTRDINDQKLALPILHLQTNHQYPGYIQALETAPVLFSTETGLPYKTEPNLFNFKKLKNINTNHRSSTNTPFSTILHNYNLGATQILPLQTSSSTAEFPQFKGARIGQISTTEFSNIPNNYQDFKFQTQLHFDGNLNNKPKNSHSNSNSAEKIRSDVEIIKKKKPVTPPPKDDNDDDDNSSEDASEEGYKSTASYFRNQDNDDSKGVTQKYFESSPFEGDFKPSKVYPFKEYNIKFGKQKKKDTNIDNDDNDDDDDESDANENDKYRYFVKSNDRDDDDDSDYKKESTENISQVTYKTFPAEKHFGSYSSDQDEKQISREEKSDKIVDFDTLHRKKTSKIHNEQEKNPKAEFEDETYRKKHNGPRFSIRHSDNYNSSDGNRETFFTPYWKDEFPVKSSKKFLHRSYRDEMGDLTNKIFSSPSLMHHFQQNKEIKGIGNNRTTPKKSFNESPHIVWEESYRLKPYNLNNGRLQPNYSTNESSETKSIVNSRKSTQKPRSITFKAPINLLKQLITADIKSSTSSRIL